MESLYGGAKFWTEKSYDNSGLRLISIRSNLKFNVTKGVLEIG